MPPCSAGFGLLAGPWWDSETENKPSNYKKLPMFKYGKMQRKIPSWLVCGSCGMCLDHTLYGIQVSWDVFLYSNHLVCENNDSLLYRHHVGPWWDSETKKMKIFSWYARHYQNSQKYCLTEIWSPMVYSLCTDTADGSWMLLYMTTWWPCVNGRPYWQYSSHMYDKLWVWLCKMCVKCRSCEIFQ